MIILVMHPILFHYFSVKIPLVEFPILKTVFVLFLFCIPQNICEGIAKVNNPDLFPLCRTDFVLMGSTIVANAPAYSEILFFKVDILPCQTCYLSKSETCKVCYLNRKNRIPPSFSKLLNQFPVHFKGKRFNLVSVCGCFIRKQICFFLFMPHHHILHWIEGNKLFRKYRKPE